MSASHTPVITADHAGCTCRQWVTPQRRDDETQGAFTLRAAREHEEHAARFRRTPRHQGQASLFNQQELF